MSIRVMTQVWDNADASGTDLLVLLALADNASDEGLAWPSIKTLSHKTRVHARTVQRRLRALADKGECSVVREGGGERATVYRVHPGGGRQIATPDTAATGDTGVRGTGDTSAALTVNHNRQEGEKGDLPKFGGKTVVRESWEMTEKVLAEFNEQAGTKLRLLTSAGEPSQAAKRIYGRVRAYPDITLADYADIIRRTLASKWWGDGNASPGVVFGPNVFEDNITRGRGKPGSKPTGRWQRRRSVEDD